MTNIRYINYNNEIYIIFGISQDKFYNLYFHIIKLNEIKYLVANNQLDSINIINATNLLIPINEVNEITNPTQLEMFKTLYE